MSMSLEAVPVPVSDTDRAKAFYTDKLGFAVDVDGRMPDGARVVQLTPPGSHCSIHIGEITSPMVPGSVTGLILVVDDAHTTKMELEAKGLTLSQVEEHPWGRHVYLSDPDGNAWTLQELFRRNESREREGTGGST